MIRTYSTNRNGSDREQGYLKSPLHKSAEKTGEIIRTNYFGILETSKRCQQSRKSDSWKVGWGAGSTSKALKSCKPELGPQNPLRSLALTEYL